MSKYVDGLMGTVHTYDPKTDVDEWIVCSVPTAPGRAQVGHSTHTSFRSAKLAQLMLFLKKGIFGWIEHIPAFGPPTIEQQLDAALYEMGIKEAME